MIDLVVACVRVALLLLAFVWVFGFIPIASGLGASEVFRGYERRRDRALAAILIVWVFAGYALYRWVIPPPINPFYGS